MIKISDLVVGEVIELLNKYGFGEMRRFISSVADWSLITPNVSSNYIAVVAITGGTISIASPVINAETRLTVHQTTRKKFPYHQLTSAKGAKGSVFKATVQRSSPLCHLTDTLSALKYNVDLVVRE